jgi:pyrroline-5-carboxylate reductase
VDRIGIIGVGEIGRAIVDGLCDGVEEPPEICLSPRGARTAAELSQRYPNVQVYWYLATLTAWAARQGISSEEADRYIRSRFQGVGRSLGDGTRSLRQLAGDHETPNGSNERIRTTWFDTANAQALSKALDALLADLA